ncbi:phosphoribosylglycinamide formyltransferase [Desulfobacterium sp. N47]
MGNIIRIGALISGGGTNLQAVIDSCELGKTDGKIVFAGSDNAGAKGLERAAKHNIPTFVVDYASIIGNFKKDPDKMKLPEDFDEKAVSSKLSIFSEDENLQKIKTFVRTRVVAEAMLLEKMEPYPFDLLILAGFMRNLTPYFIDRINTDSENPRIMNIHPALLPAFPGVDGYGDTFRYGAKVGGCTVHFIDYGEDSGPIIGQRAFEINKDDTIESIKKKGLALEWELYPECIRLFAQKRLKIISVINNRQNGEKYSRKVVKILDP